MATAALLAASVTLRPQSRIQVRCAKPSQVHHSLWFTLVSKPAFTK